MSLPRTLLSLAVLMAWVVMLLYGFNRYPLSDSVFPPLLIHTSALLLMALLIRMQGFNLQNTWQFKPCRWVWLMTAVIFGIFYWVLDALLMAAMTTPQVQTAKQLAWQASVAEYSQISVAFSTVLMAPVFEELLFRGWLLQSMLSARPTSFSWQVVSITVISALFALIHWSWPDGSSVFIAGWFYGYLTLKSNSVLPALCAHITHNAMTYASIYFLAEFK